MEKKVVYKKESDKLVVVIKMSYEEYQNLRSSVNISLKNAFIRDIDSGNGNILQELGSLLQSS